MFRGRCISFSLFRPAVGGSRPERLPAARDTSSLIDGSIGKAHESKERLERVANAVRSINEHAERVKAVADNVCSGSQEQNGGIGQIAGALQQMEQVTRRTATGARQGAAAGRDLSERSDALKSLVDGLAALVGRSVEEKSGRL